MSVATEYDVLLARSREAFERDTAEHEMKVLRDDGLYRHLRFQRRTDAWLCWFDLVTWPGRLVVCGDMGDYMFARLEDIFAFFGARRFEDVRYGINPHYWGEKLRGPRPGRDGAMSYSPGTFRQHVVAWHDEVSAEMDEESVAELWRAIEGELLGDDVTYDEDAAHAALRDFEHRSLRIEDSWEWDLREYDYAYLWCCWAIVWGIEQYRTAKSESS